MLCKAVKRLVILSNESPIYSPDSRQVKLAILFYVHNRSRCIWQTRERPGFGQYGYVSEVEESLDPESTPSAVERATEFVNAISLPAMKE